MNNREFGNKGEDLACEYLLKNGYEIVNKDYQGIMQKIFPNTIKYVTKLVYLLGDNIK